MTDTYRTYTADSADQEPCGAISEQQDRLSPWLRFLANQAARARAPRPGREQRAERALCLAVMVVEVLACLAVLAIARGLRP